MIDLSIGPSPDVLSFTHAGKHVADSGRLFPIAIASLYKAVGTVQVAFPLYKTLCLCVFLCLVYYYNAKKNKDPYVFLLSMLSISVFLLGVNSRPEVISLPLNFAMLMILTQIRELTYKTGFWIGLFLLVWINWHVSAVAGFLTIGAFYLFFLIQSWPSRPAVLRILIIGTVTFFIPFLNPDGRHFLQGFHSFDLQKWNQVIEEIKPFDMATEVIYVKILLVLAVVVLNAAIYRRHWAFVFLIIVFARQTFLLEKFSIHLAVLVCFALIYFHDVLTQVFTHERFGKYAKGLIIGVSGLVVIDMYSDLKHHSKNMFIGEKFFTNLPQQLDKYIVDNKITGNVLNPYEAGGYIAYKHWPNLKVSIDGRSNILYDYEFTKKMLEGEFNPDSFSLVIEDHQPDYIMGDTLKANQLIDWGTSSQLYRFEFVSRDFALMSKGGTKYKLSTSLYNHPECLDAVSPSELQSELSTAEKELPADSQLLSYLRFASDYLSAKDKSAYLETTLNNVVAEQHWKNRAAAALAFKNKQIKVGLELYSYVLIEPRSKDVFKMLEHICTESACQKADKLFFVFKKTGVSEDQIEKFRMYRSRIMEHMPNIESQEKFDREAKGVRVRVPNNVDDGGCDEPSST